MTSPRAPQRVGSGHETSSGAGNKATFGQAFVDGQRGHTRATPSGECLHAACV